MKRMTVSGKTIDEAIDAGLTQWGVTKDQVEVSILAEPAKGLFGLFGSKEAVVELTLLSQPIDKALLFLDDLFRAMNLHITIEQKQTPEAIILDLQGPELASVIGRRGQTLDALQYLVNIIANRQSQERFRFILDAEDFRSRRSKTLQQLALRLAQRVVRTGKEVVIEPMPASERKVIHSYLQDHPEVRTQSKGEEPFRRVVVLPK